MSDIGKVSLIRCMMVTRDYTNGTLSSSRQDYVINILKRFEMQDCNPVHTPAYGSELSNEQPEETGRNRYNALPGYRGVGGIFDTMHTP